MIPRILIVEDHKDFRRAMVNFLELNKVKARMMEACTGEEGVLLARKVKPRIVIMDSFLNGINSIETARQIKKQDPKCNIIMLTMFDTKEIAFVQRNRLIKTYIGKSELCDQLIPAIDKALRN